jgi:hypothetical protein
MSRNLRNFLPVGFSLFLLYFLAFFTFVPYAAADWKQDWEKTVAAAEKEGEVVMYGQGRVGVSDAIREFQ